MAGYGLDEKFHLSTILEKNLKQKGFNISEVINASVSGDTTSGGLNRLNWLLEQKINLVILCLGANDMLRGIDPNIIKNNLDKMLQILKKNKIKVVLAGMLSQEIYGKEYKNNFDSIYPGLAKNLILLFLPFLLDGVALRPEYNLSDGKHPNAKGTNLISKNLEKILIKILDD